MKKLADSKYMYVVIYSVAAAYQTGLPGIHPDLQSINVLILL